MIALVGVAQALALEVVRPGHALGERRRRARRRRALRAACRARARGHDLRRSSGAPAARRCTTVLFNVGTLTLASLAAAAVFAATPDARARCSRRGRRRRARATSPSTWASLSLALALEGHERWCGVFRERFAWLLPSYVVYGFVGGVIAIGYDAAGLYALAVFAVPLLLMRKTQEAYLAHTQRSAQKLREAAETIQTQNVSLEQANRLLKERSTAAMESLSATVDARDSYTAGHSRRVQQLALAIGRELGLSQAELDLLGHAALFHDIGKLAIPDADPAQAREPHRRGVGADAAARRRGRAHHRPARLPRTTPCPRSATTTSAGTAPATRTASQGEEIPLGARIIHVADALDSMLTTRIYRAARPAEEALGELRRATGTQFCPRVVDALERILRARAGARVRAGPAAAQPRANAHRLVGAGQLALCFSTLYPSWRGPEGEAVPRRRGIDPDALAAFRAGIRKRYSDEQHPRRAAGRSAERLGRSPTMREFAADRATTVHPQTVIEHFGSWNAAKRAAGLVPRRFATREELLGVLRELGRGARAARRPRATSTSAAGSMPSKSLYWHTFGSLADRAARGRLRRAGGGGAARARGRAGRGARAPARTPAEVRRLGGGAAGGPGAAHRVAGLPDVRGAPRRVVDVPVPRPRARCASGASPSPPTGRWLQAR